MRTSVFKSMGIGYVLSNRTLQSREIEVYLPEQGNMKDGEILPGEFNLTYSVTDINNLVRSGKISTSNTFVMKWLPDRAIQVEPPSVRRGERVEVFVMGDSDIFYWRELGLDSHLRKLDTVIIAISNTTDETVTELTADNTYWFEFSTHSKKLAFVTSKSDGEPYAYSFVLDTKEGNWKWTDDVANPNSFTWNSKEESFTFLNSSLSTISLVKNVIQAHTDEGGDILIEGPDVTITNGEGSVTSMIGGELTMKSPMGGKLVINADVVATSSGGSQLSLTGTDATLADASGGMVVITGGTVNSN